MRTPARRTALALAATAVSVTAACTPAPHAAQRATPSSPASTAPSCTPDFGPDASGLNAFGGTVTASVALDCTGPYTTPDPLISLTLVRQPPGSATADAAGAQAYQSPQLTYTTSGTCAPGQWALHILWGATVDGHALSGQQWGKPITLTAADCG